MGVGGISYLYSATIFFHSQDEKNRPVKMTPPNIVDTLIRDIKNLKSDEEELEVIKEVIEGIKSDGAAMREIEKIKSHEWVKVIEG